MGPGKRRVAQAAREQNFVASAAEKKGSVAMSTVKVKWNASEELVREEFIATGNKPPKTREFEIDLTELTVEQRRPLIEWSEERYGPIDLTTRFEFIPDKPVFRIKHAEPHTHTFDNQPAVEQVIEFVESNGDAIAKAKAHEAKLEAARQAEHEAKLAEYERVKLEIDALIEARDLEGLNELKLGELWSFSPSKSQKFSPHDSLSSIVDEARKEIKRERREAEKESWILANGSDHLKSAFAEGYDCQRLYVTERAAQEAPGFIVDFDDNADWRSRSCPTERAMEIVNEAREFGIREPRVVWLTSPPGAEIVDEYEPYEPFEACEAVVIRNYLGRYDLVQIV
jgi:hypothetical protein